MWFVNIRGYQVHVFLGPYWDIYVVPPRNIIMVRIENWPTSRSHFCVSEVSSSSSIIDVNNPKGRHAHDAAERSIVLDGVVTGRCWITH